MQVLDSFIDAALEIPDECERDELIGMIVCYLRTGTEPKPHTVTQCAVITAIRPVMEKSHVRIIKGSKGGSKTPSKDASKRPSEEEEEEDIGRSTSLTKSVREVLPAPAQTDELPTDDPRIYPPTPEQVRTWIEANALMPFDWAKYVAIREAAGWIDTHGRPIVSWHADAKAWSIAERERAAKARSPAGQAGRAKRGEVVSYGGRKPWEPAAGDTYEKWA